MNGSRLSKWELAPRACPKTLFEIVGAWDFSKTHRIGLLKRTIVLRTFHTVFDHDFQNGRRYFEHAFNNIPNMTFEVNDCALDMCSETLFNMNFLNGRTYFTHISNTSNRALVLSKWALAPRACPKTLFEIVGAWDFFENTSNRTFEKDDCASDISHCSIMTFKMGAGTSNMLSITFRTWHSKWATVLWTYVRKRCSTWTSEMGARTSHTHFEHVEPGTGTFEMGACASDVFENTNRNCWKGWLCFGHSTLSSIKPFAMAAGDSAIFVENTVRNEHQYFEQINHTLFELYFGNGCWYFG